MQVTNVEVWPVANGKSIQARARFSLDSGININCTVLKNKDGGLFIGLPAKLGEAKDGAKKWYYDVFVTDQDLLKEINVRVLEAYGDKAKLSDASNSGSATADETIPF